MQIASTPFAGAWYPDDPAELRELLEDVFEESERRTGKRTRPGALGFIVPHAAIKYSGAVAAATYRCLAANPPRRVLLLGFLHSRRHCGLAIPSIDAYCTPLGRLDVDRELADELCGRAPFQSVASREFCDHSLEIQLPLLQWVCADVAVVPIYVGELKEHELAEAGAILAEAVSDGAVVVASSDLTHYGNRFGFLPFHTDKDVQENLRLLDEDTMVAAGSLDAERFLGELRRSGSTMCGRAPISLLLKTMSLVGRSETFQQTLDYCTSGELTGDWEGSVSYGATGYFPAEAFSLCHSEASALLHSARRVLNEYAATRRRAPGTPTDESEGTTPGAFVTITLDGRLRGCVGRLKPALPVGTLIPALALSAALDDPRFPPLAASQIPYTRIEISVLTPLKRVAGVHQFELGKHGAQLECGACRSILLPQVGRRKGWTSDRFMDALAEKAGLTSEQRRWRDTILSVFQAFSYHEQ